MGKIENILHRIDDLKATTGVSRTLLAVCPNSLSVIKAAFRAAKRNNSPIMFAATLNQIDNDGGYTGITQYEFINMLRLEAEYVNYTGPYIAAVDHGGPWLKDIQVKEKWNLEKAMISVKKSFEDAISAGYDLIHVDPTVDIYIAKDNIIDIKVVAARTVELINHCEMYRRKINSPSISYEVGTEEVHGGLANETVFDIFISELKSGLKQFNLVDIWPTFIVGKVGTDLHTTTFDKSVASKLTEKVRPLASYIKGHYTDGVKNPEDYPLCGIGAANVGPEFTISEYNGLIELEKIEIKFYKQGDIAKLSNMKDTLWRLVYQSNRWQKWLFKLERSQTFDELLDSRKEWLVQTGCRYIWQHPETIAARSLLFNNLLRHGIDAEEVLLGRIEHDMDKYFHAFNLVNFNDYME
jgi:tagatose-1,6-bisphosphate aldolase non-catalytic subunit AgaZ/GatZ